MLYLDYARKAGEWIPNRYGGRENLEAIEFLRSSTRRSTATIPDVQTIAEESTAWPMVSRPTYSGGLGFGMKWNMGWMHDTLDYMQRGPDPPPVPPRTSSPSRCCYAFTENFVLPLSHDEVVHGKGSLLGKMPGDDWQQVRQPAAAASATCGPTRARSCCSWAASSASGASGTHDRELDWDLLDDPAACRRAALGRRPEPAATATSPALHELDFDAGGFEWVDCNDAENSVLRLAAQVARRPAAAGGVQLHAGAARRLPRRRAARRPLARALNSDAALYGGSGVGNLGGVDTVPVSAHGRYQSLDLTLPPLGMLMFEPRCREAPSR